MGKLLVRYSGSLFLLVTISLIVIVLSGLNPNCEAPKCSGQPCNSLSKNDCPSPCFCSRMAPYLPISCNFCSKENCPCSNSKLRGGLMKPCCSGLSCLSYDSEEAAGPGTCGES